MILVPILVVVAGLALDVAFGDPKNKFHPTAWVGKIVAYLVPKVRSTDTHQEKIGGAVVTLLVTGLVAFLIFLFVFLTKQLDVVSSTPAIIASAILFKTTIAIKGLQKHGELVLESVLKNNLDQARERLSLLVKRDTKELDKEHIISGVLESTSENIVDSVTGPLFYFGLFGLVGAFVYRTINTIDAMAGYRNKIFENVGWFGANCDKVLNYIPARITAYVMVLAAFLIGADWKKALYTIKKDSKKTSSPNAGYAMAAMAGALQTRFEKISHYTLGDGVAPQVDHFKRAMLLVKITCFIFLVLVTIPMITILYYLGWWLYV